MEVAALVGPAAHQGGPHAAVDAFFPLVCGGLWSTLDEAAKDRYRANGHMMLAEFRGRRTRVWREYSNEYGLQERSGCARSSRSAACN
jgi:hypothetical protein